MTSGLTPRSRFKSLLSSFFFMYAKFTGGATLIFDTELVAVNGKPSSGGNSNDVDDSEL